VREMRRISLELARQQSDPAREFTTGSGNIVTYRWAIAHVIQHDSYTAGQAVLMHEVYKKLHV
jgi:uncharacterized damage-inducible protein DinB